MGISIRRSGAKQARNDQKNSSALVKEVDVDGLKDNTDAGVTQSAQSAVQLAVVEEQAKVPDQSSTTPLGHDETESTGLVCGRPASDWLGATCAGHRRRNGASRGPGPSESG